MDAVIHNAGAYSTKGRSPTPEGHPTIIAVNALAPYVLTALMERPRRLVYLSSGMHRGGSGSLRDFDWSERRWNFSQAYSDSKLYLTALAFAVARRWPDVLSNAVDPGWVATKMGGASAPDERARRRASCDSVLESVASPSLQLLFPVQHNVQMRHWRSLGRLEYQKPLSIGGDVVRAAADVGEVSFEKTPRRL